MSYLKENEPNATNSAHNGKENKQRVHVALIAQLKLMAWGGKFTPPHIYTGKVKTICSGDMRRLDQKLPKLLNTILLF